MAKQVMQFRYYGENEAELAKNYPSEISKSNLQNGTLFSDYYPIIQLGIQSLPGTEFALNDSNSSVIIGSTGIFELAIEGYAEITNLSFKSTSLELIDENPNAYLIIDIISNKEVEN